MNLIAIKEMAQAHLESVKQRISELQNKKQLIEQEIGQLLHYYESRLVDLSSDNVE